jgi:valyl-tRNA synthetase
MKKLNNERFVAGAPSDVIERENTKKTDAESKIASLEKQIENLK